MNDHLDLDHTSPADRGETTDERLRRLEAALAAMQDTQLMEQRLLERVSERLGTGAPPAGDSNAIIEAGKVILPGMVRAVGSQLNSATSPTAPASGSLFSARTWIV